MKSFLTILSIMTISLTATAAPVAKPGTTITRGGLTYIFGADSEGDLCTVLIAQTDRKNLENDAVFDVDYDFNLAEIQDTTISMLDGSENSKRPVDVISYFSNDEAYGGLAITGTKADLVKLLSGPAISTAGQKDSAYTVTTRILADGTRTMGLVDNHKRHQDSVKMTSAELKFSANKKLVSLSAKLERPKFIGFIKTYDHIIQTCKF